MFPQLGITNTQFGVILSFYVYPAIVMSFVVGILCDRFGFANLLLVCGAIMCVGIVAEVSVADHSD